MTASENRLVLTLNVNLPYSAAAMEPGHTGSWTLRLSLRTFEGFVKMFDTQVAEWEIEIY